MQRVQEHLNPRLDIGGVLLTMYDARLNLSRQVVADAREHFGDRVFDTVVPRNIRLAEAPSFGKPIVLYDIASVGAQAYMAVAKELLQRDRGEQSRRRSPAPHPSHRLSHGHSSTAAGQPPPGTRPRRTARRPEAGCSRSCRTYRTNTVTGRGRHIGAPHPFPLGQIRANPYQPRQEFRPEQFADLEASLKINGLLQPITVRPSPQRHGLRADRR